LKNNRDTDKSWHLWQVPVVGFSPIKSLEQLGPLGVLVAIQLMEFIEVQRRKRKMTTAEVMLLRLKVRSLHRKQRMRIAETYMCFHGFTATNSREQKKKKKRKKN
jgi:hypothetical protein